MPCYHPWKLDQQTLPCGRCFGCRLERSRQWAVRCMHEKQLHELNSYITLTYRDPLPSISLVHKHYQDFMKRLRRKYSGQDVRYYMAGEYGELTRRPHFHAILFGIDFQDKYPWRKNAQGDQLYRSATLELLWKHGDSTLGAVTFQSAAYVARYVMKKITGDLAPSHYTVLTADGELIELKPEYNRMSLRPAIGKRWYERFKSDVYPRDLVVTNGHEGKPPRYYDKLLDRQDEEAFHTIRSARAATYRSNARDNTPRRLAAKEKVAIARATKLKRAL